jgi:hypothetical protein
MQCPNGHENPESQRFCGECGAPLAPPPVTTEASSVAPGPTQPEHADAPTKPRRRRRTWVVVGVVVVAIVAIVAGASSGSDTSDDVKRASGKTHSSVVRNHSTVAPAPTTAATTHAVKITGNGFTQLPPDSIGNSYLSYGVVVENPSDDVAERVALNVAFYNDAGVVVKAENPTIDVILPNQTAAYGDSTEAAGATRMEVQVLVGSWEPATTTTGAFTAAGVTTDQQSYGGLKTNATLSSTFVKDLKEVVAAAIYYDGNGAIIGGARTFVDFVPAGGQAAVEITSFNDLPTLARTDVYGELSNLSLFGT